MKEIISEIKQIKSSDSDLRNFGLIVGIGLFIFGSILLYLHKSAAPYILGISPVLILTGYLLPVALKPFQKIWMSFAVVMGWFMNHLILILVFYLLITPFGLIARLFKKAFLQKKIDHSAKTYWINREAMTKDKESYTRQF
ncbi:hypothetical protein JXJ21_06240 [candidate division KSB1 bacterium]|nr:hypothetical protein [candidate division KSB1 bacterium]